MSEKTLYPYQGKQISGEPVGIESSSEPFAQYTLEDGTSVKVKLVMLEAVRLEGYTDQGDPLYQFQFQQIIGVMAPETLKRKSQ